MPMKILIKMKASFTFQGAAELPTRTYTRVPYNYVMTEFLLLLEYCHHL